MNKFILFFVLTFSFLLNAQNVFAQNFNFDKNAEHVILFIPNEGFGISQELAVEIAKYNAEYHIKQKLNIKQYKIPFLSKKATVYVETLENYDQAKSYLKKIKERNPDFQRSNILEYSLPISKENLSVLIQLKDKSAYLAFLENLP